MKWHKLSSGISWRFEKKWEDKWIGVYHKIIPKKSKFEVDHLHIWLCIIPCFPIHLDIILLPRSLY